MLRVFFLTFAAICGLMVAGFVFGWGFWVFDEFGWQRDWAGWAGLSLFSGWLSFHPWVFALDRALDGRGGQ
jgi:hypothetical protein